MANASVEEKTFLPDRFRIDAAKRTPEQEEILRRADAQQQKWREDFAQPFLHTSPQTRERARASIVIEEYERQEIGTLTPHQKEELAAAYAQVGRFELAYRVEPDRDRKNEYRTIFNAIYKTPDERWCKCDRRQQFLSLEVYSPKHERVVALMKCANCGFMNAADLSDRLKTARVERAAHREMYKGLGPQEVKRLLSEQR